ncbi:MAG TPA: outer membrane beta-barrel protein [Kofleriaceae bacterium]|nr:outer membrane beta-barrel protein [Kofleriaceae bacterium]
MIRWTHGVLASLGLTGVAAAQPYAPPPSSPPPPPPAAGPAAGPAAPEYSARTPQSRIGADLAFVLPVGDYADGADAAFGPFGRLELALNPQLSVTGRLGFLYHFTEAAEDLDISYTMFPIYGGLRYNVEPSGDGLFLTGEAGLNIIRVSVSFFGQDSSDTSTKLSLNMGAGYQAGLFNVKGTLFFTADVGGGSGGDGTNLVGLMAAVGFDFVAM